MRIDNGFLTGVNAVRSGLTPRAGKVGTRRGKNAAAPGLTSSSELVQFFALLAQEPEVRLEVVDQAENRLARGFYLEPETAERTARAMLDAGD